MEKEELRDYFTNELKWGWGHQQRIVFDFLCDAAREAKHGVILDAGAGYQRYKPFFSESTYIAQEHPIAGQQNKNIQTYDILADVKKIPLRDNSVDLILSTSSLEHLEFPELFFTESYRVLKGGGALYVHVPFVYMEHEVPYDFQRPTRYGLRRYYTHAGFEKIEVEPTSSSIYVAQFFFLQALVEDGKRCGKKAGRKWLNEIIYFLASSFCKLVLRLYDQGPFPNTKFPVGWVAKGYKKGPAENRKAYGSPREFINQNAECGDDTVLQDGVILAKS